MTEKTELVLYLPGFGGFHGTTWEDLFPFSLESRAEEFAKEEGSVGLSAADFSDILRERCDASRFFTSVAQRFCRRFDAETSRWIGFELALTFYQFDLSCGLRGTTDHILVTMPVVSARKLFARSAEEGHQRLRRRFADYDGEAPYPADAVEQWLAGPVELWGRAALCDLLAGFVDPEIDERLYADMAASGEIRMSFEDAVDWERFSQQIAVHRRARGEPWLKAAMPPKPLQ